MRKIDRTGRQYGSILVLGDSGEKQNKQIRWKCRCSCGKELLITSANLLRGQKSCGCKRRYSQWSRIQDRDEALRKFIYQRFLRGPARARRIEWSLTYEQAITLSQQNCHYCGTPPQAITTDSRHRRGKVQKNSDAVIYWNGLDRVDNDSGYSMDNVVTCCKFCNISKSTRTYEEFKKWVERIYWNMCCAGINPNYKRNVWEQTTAHI